MTEFGCWDYNIECVHHDEWKERNKTNSCQIMTKARGNKSSNSDSRNSAFYRSLRTTLFQFLFLRESLEFAVKPIFKTNEEIEYLKESPTPESDLSCSLSSPPLCHQQFFVLFEASK